MRIGKKNVYYGTFLKFRSKYNSLVIKKILDNGESLNTS